jgi:hypothetical protein
MKFIENRNIDGQVVGIYIYEGREVNGPALRPASYFENAPKLDLLIGALSKRQVELMQGGKLK